MLIKDIVRELDGVGCDGVKIGDPNKEVTKIAVTMWATPRVIQKAAELGANLIITHEPTFYTDADAARDNPVDKLKLELIKKADVVICRYHTKMHRITPDLIPTGALYYLGLGGKLEPTEYFGSSIFTSDEPISANEMAVLIKERLGVKHIRIAGNGDFKGKTVGMCLGSPAGVFDILCDPKTDFVLVGEACEWCQCEYARDAAELGINKAIIVLGHEGSERAGMRYLAKLLTEKYPQIKTEYIECGEVYN